MLDHMQPPEAVVAPQQQRLCSSCQFALPEGSKFCPQCGKKVESEVITMGEQIKLYALSFLLPPFGLIPGIKNLTQKDPSRKRAGVIAIILTLVSIGLSIWFSYGVISQVNTILNGQLQDYNTTNLLK